MPFTLAPLPYAPDALVPHIDAATMEIHHGKHHNAYVTNLNAALEKAPELASWTIEQLNQRVAEVPEAVRTAVRNNGGGHWNHALFWASLSPAGGGEPTGALGDAITAAFGSFDAFKTQFAAAAMGRFGSGWAWLVKRDGALVITSTPNQDNPMMDGAAPGDILLGLDVWEHAYYLNYQNRRADYIAAFWHVVDWSAVSARFGA
jgi:Fe-Mn family superoxide dismutase